MSEQVTFWSAAKEIVAECHAILKPGGVAVWVTKDFVRAKQRVPFSADWVRLCESCGFTLVKWARASLVSETRHGDLFLGETVKRTERKSFFRRLAEKKGSPRIDHEDVLIFRKGAGEGEIDAVVGSPPFLESLADAPSQNVRERLGHTMGRGVLGDGYGSTPGQLGALPAGNVDAVIGSPPFSGTEQPCASQLQAMKDYHAFTRGDGTKRDATLVGATVGQLSAMEMGTVDAVVYNQLENATSYCIIDGKGGAINDLSEATGGQRATEARRAEIVGTTQDGDSVALQRTRPIVEVDSEVLRRNHEGSSERVFAAEDSDKKQGSKKRTVTLQVQGRQGSETLQNGDREGQVQEVRYDGELRDSPQERRSLRQPTREFGGTLQFLPHEPHQESVVGSEESRIANAQEQRPDGVEEASSAQVDCILSSPPYAEIASGAGGLNTKPPKHEGQQGGRAPDSASQDTDQRYGESAGQLSRMAAGTVDAVVSSPPFAQSLAVCNTFAAREPGKGRWAGGNDSAERLKGDYITPNADGQLGTMPEGEQQYAEGQRPPYAEETWARCYDESWKGLIVDGAFAHPAKMARGLVRRIFDELFAMGAIQKGLIVLDPFGGIATTGIEGASRGVRVICVELEAKFISLSLENMELHRPGWEAVGLPLPIIIQGDSRRLRAHRERAAAGRAV